MRSPARSSFEALLPSTAIVVSSRGDLTTTLFPEEERVVVASVDKRRREFVTGRACAREALSRLGVPAAPVPAGPGGDPRWPPGIVGSITHCEGYRACAVARADDVSSLGIDAEPDLPLPSGLLRDIALVSERRWVGEMAAARPWCSWDRLLFCIKEAIYKAWFPLTQTWLGFEDAAVLIDPGTGLFSARLLVPTPTRAGGDLSRLEGRWLARDGLLMTALAVDLVRRGAPG